MSELAIGRLVFPLVFLFGVLCTTSLLLRAGFPSAWRTWLGRLIVVGAVLALGGFLGWQVLRFFAPTSRFSIGPVTLTTLVMGASLLVAVSSPLWGPVAFLAQRQPLDTRRRAFLQRLSGAIPAAAATTSPIGTATSFAEPVLRTLEVKSTTVPAALDGFTILHLTDIHLGVFIGPAQVKAVVDAVLRENKRPDLVALTGDIADDLSQLPEALASLRALGARHGIVASIGNHEIYRGRERALALYEAAGIPVLCDNGIVVEQEGAQLFVAGADDPGRGIDGSDAFLRTTVDRAFAACAADVSCRVLLSHRPRGFLPATRHGATLTLSGHTHGGQAALFRRSLATPLFPDSFLLGHYSQETERGTCHLYTSAGLGHWMPLRINCPAEAALVTLRSERSSTESG
jgi:predicted MPP superfamily phosphohydrolase